MNRRKNHFFYLRSHTAKDAIDARARATGMGLAVPSVLGDSAIIVAASDEEAQALLDTGLFAFATTRNISRTKTAQMDATSKTWAGVWNLQFDERYRAIKRDRSKIGLRWTALNPPAPPAEARASVLRAAIKDLPRGQRIGARTAARGRPPVTPAELKRRVVETRTHGKLVAYLAARGAGAAAEPLARSWQYLSPRERQWYFNPALLEVMARSTQASLGGAS